MLKVPPKSFSICMDFTDLAHFLHNIVGAQLNIGGAQALQRDIKLHLCPGFRGARRVPLKK